MFNQSSFNGKTANGVDVDQTYGMPDKRAVRTCFVVANRGIAHILEQKDRSHPPQLIQTLENDTRRATDISSDARGRVFQSTHTGARSAYERTTPTEEETQDFCRAILKQVQKISEGADRLVLVASPHFLGSLRQQVRKHSLGVRSIQDYAKDLSKTQPRDLPQRLQSLIA